MWYFVHVRVTNRTNQLVVKIHVQYNVLVLKCMYWTCGIVLLQNQVCVCYVYGFIQEVISAHVL